MNVCSNETMIIGTYKVYNLKDKQGQKMEYKI